MKWTNMQVTVLVTSLLFSVTCMADNGLEHHSKVEGVNLFWMMLLPKQVAPEYIPSDLFTYGEQKELVRHCNGINKIYIYELGSKAFVCRSLDGGKSVDSEEHHHTIEILGIEDEDIKRAPHLYQGNQGIYTVSTKLIPQQHFEMRPLSGTEIARVQQLSKGKYTCPRNEDVQCQMLKNDLGNEVVTTEDISRQSMRILMGSTELLFAPIAIVRGFGGEVIYILAALSKTGESYKYVGDFSGSLIRVGADIDRDGVPDLLIDESEFESQEIAYVKIYPKIESLVSYKHW